MWAMRKGSWLVLGVGGRARHRGLGVCLKMEPWLFSFDVHERHKSLILAAHRAWMCVSLSTVCGSCAF